MVKDVKQGDILYYANCFDNVTKLTVNYYQSDYKNETRYGENEYYLFKVERLYRTPEECMQSIIERKTKELEALKNGNSKAETIK